MWGHPFRFVELCSLTNLLPMHKLFGWKFLFLWAHAERESLDYALDRPTLLDKSDSRPLIGFAQGAKAQRANARCESSRPSECPSHT